MNDREVNVIEYKPENSRTILKTDSIVDSVIDKYVNRAQFGKQKYGTTMDRQDLSTLQWIEHAIEEHMDAVVYLTRLKEDIKRVLGA